MAEGSALHPPSRSTHTLAARSLARLQAPLPSLHPPGRPPIRARRPASASKLLRPPFCCCRSRLSAHPDPRSLPLLLFPSPTSPSAALVAFDFDFDLDLNLAAVEPSPATAPREHKGTRPALVLASPRRSPSLSRPPTNPQEAPCPRTPTPAPSQPRHFVLSVSRPAPILQVSCSPPIPSSQAGSLLRCSAPTPNSPVSVGLGLTRLPETALAELFERLRPLHPRCP